MPLREAHGNEMFKNEGLAPDANERLDAFMHRKDSQM
jgi:hypothetical protein